jgi:hypothetical protein
VRPTVHGNHAARKPGGVHTITAADERRDGFVALEKVECVARG